jgi:hypothetical protein
MKHISYVLKLPGRLGGWRMINVRITFHLLHMWWKKKITIRKTTHRSPVQVWVLLILYRLLQHPLKKEKGAIFYTNPDTIQDSFYKIIPRLRPVTVAIAAAFCRTSANNTIKIPQNKFKSVHWLMGHSKTLRQILWLATLRMPKLKVLRLE